jgi:hypothetical protein
MYKLIIRLEEAYRQMVIEGRRSNVQAAAGRERKAEYVFLRDAANLLGARHNVKGGDNFPVRQGDPENYAPVSAAEIVARLACRNVGLGKENVLISLDPDAHIIVEVAGYAQDRAVIDGVVAEYMSSRVAADVSIGN